MNFIGESFSAREICIEKEDILYHELGVNYSGLDVIRSFSDEESWINDSQVHIRCSDLDSFTIFNGDPYGDGRIEVVLLDGRKVLSKRVFVTPGIGD